VRQEYRFDALVIALTIHNAAHGIQYVTLKFISLPNVDDFVNLFLKLLEIACRSVIGLLPEGSFDFLESNLGFLDTSLAS
jgi:hypothetical protein